MTQTHYENFSVATWLLPRQLRPHFHAVYAYCRWADDLADETANSSKALELLAWWRGELLDCYEGRATHPVMIALQDTIRRFPIPRDCFLNLLLAFEQDQQVKEYQTFSELLQYCTNSANPVGRIVLYLFHEYDEFNASYSDSICTGLQLVNFWQDVSRDHQIHRKYLPAEDRVRFGYSEDDYLQCRFTPEFRNLMQFEIERTEQFFDRGEPLLDRLHSSARRNIQLFLDGGRAVIEAIQSQDYDVWSRRPVVTKRKKMSILMRSFFGYGF